MTSEVSKTEYLKRYLENEKDKKRKHKKKTKLSNPHMPRLKILHENIDIKAIKFGDQSEDDDDEAPVVAEVIDERPVEVKLKELYESSRWKKLDENERLHSGMLPNSKSKEGDYDISPILSGKESISSRKSTTKNSSLLHEKNLSTLSGQQRKQQDSNSDLSPPKQNEAEGFKDKRHDSDSDLSPFRYKEIQRFGNKRDNSDSDLSPPRYNETQRHDSKRHDSDSDFSPPRCSDTQRLNNKIPDLSSDISPSNDKLKAKSKNKPNAGYEHESLYILKDKNAQKSYEKRGRSRHRHDSDSDLSPVRKKTSKSPCNVVRKSKMSSNKCNSDSDLSPPRKGIFCSIENSKSEKNRPDKTLSGLSAGLQNAAVLKQETQDLREREKKQINELHEELSGKNADTIIRDRKTGLKRNIEEEKKAKEEELKKTAEYQKKYTEWGKGIQQTERKLNKFCDDMYEMSKPLARYYDDEDLEIRLKSVIHDDDPMAEYVKKKRKQKMPSVPVYSGPPAPPNRFGILPGYRWDGVDRSNGFEKRYFEKNNTAKAVEEEAYLWSVQNM